MERGRCTPELSKSSYVNLQHLGLTRCGGGVSETSDPGRRLGGGGRGALMESFNDPFPATVICKYVYCVLNIQLLT